MTAIRSSDAALAARLSGHVQTTQARIAREQLAIATGKTATAHSDLSTSSGTLARARTERIRLDYLATENERASNTLLSVDGALGDIAEGAERFRTLLIQRLNGSTGADVPLASEIASLAQEVTARLNTRLDGRYLFGGSATDRPPVALPDPLPSTLGVADYYQGDDRDLLIGGDNATMLSFAIRADDPAFAALFSAMGEALSAHASGDEAGLRAALAGTELAIDGLAGKRADAGVLGARLDDLAAAQRASLGYVDEVISSIEDTDLPAAVSRLANDVAALEATYLTIGRLNGLSLADYLR